MISRLHAKRNPVAIEQVAVICPLDSTWPVIWQRLLDGDAPAASAPACDAHRIDGLDRSIALDSAKGAASRLALQVVNDVICSGDPVFGGSTYGESDLVEGLVQNKLSGHAHWDALMIDPMPMQLHPHYVEQWVYASCCSGMVALTLGIMRGVPAVALGVDAASSLGSAGFWRLGATSPDTCQPFIENHHGTVVSEGAAALRICPHDQTENPLGTIEAVAVACEAGHPTAPSRDGDGLACVIRKVLNAADLKPNDIQAVVAHGTGTKLNDATEASVLRKLFGGDAVPVTSVKHALGHTMAASGLINIAVALYASREGRIPSTIPSLSAANKPITGIDLVIGPPREITRGGPVLALNAGFGGGNAAAIITGNVP